MLKEINFANIELVEVDENRKPRCKLHGAMNKLTVYSDKSGIWRCITVVSNDNDNVCRAGCQF